MCLWLELTIKGFKKYTVMNAQDDLLTAYFLWEKSRLRWGDACTAASPGLRMETRRIKYGVHRKE